VWLAEQARELIVQTQDGDYTLGRRGGPIDQLDAVMRTICADLKLTDKVTPHDLRRTFSSKVTALGFGRDAMNRVTNHKEGGIADVYDRHEYAEENRRIMEEVATHIIALAEGKPVPSNVEQFKKAM
jgi:integrase